MSAQKKGNCDNLQGLNLILQISHARQRIIQTLKTVRQTRREGKVPQTVQARSIDMPWDGNAAEGNCTENLRRSIDETVDNVGGSIECISNRTRCGLDELVRLSSIMGSVSVYAASLQRA